MRTSTWLGSMVVLAVVLAGCGQGGASIGVAALVAAAALVGCARGAGDEDGRSSEPAATLTEIAEPPGGPAPDVPEPEPEATAAPPGPVARPTGPARPKPRGMTHRRAAPARRPGAQAADRAHVRAAYRGSARGGPGRRLGASLRLEDLPARFREAG